VRNPAAELDAIEQALHAARTRPGVRSIPSLPDDTLTVPLLENVHEPALPEFEGEEWADLSVVRVGPELQNETVQKLVELVFRVVDVEGPVHVDLVYERVRDRYGLRRAGQVIQGRIDGAIGRAIASGQIERLPEEPEFLSIPGRLPAPKVREPEFAPRKVEHVSIAELASGLVRVAHRLYGASEVDLVRETRERFGYLRLGDTINRRLSVALAYAIQIGWLARSGDLIVPSGEPNDV